MIDDIEGTFGTGTFCIDGMLGAVGKFDTLGRDGMVGTDGIGGTEGIDGGVGSEKLGTECFLIIQPRYSF